MNSMKATPNYSVIYSDDDIVVLNKRSGLLTAADRYDTEALRLDTEAEKEFGKLYAVHRIDKDTSGLIIYARNADAHKSLSIQFEEREVKKEYHCLVNGHPLWREHTVDLKLEPDGDSRHRTIPNPRGGKISITDFTLIGNCGPYSWVKACPRTGRTHQIRAHLQSLNLSIVCDPLYSANQKPVFLSDVKRKWNGKTDDEKPLLSRLALHAYSLTLEHPRLGHTMNFKASYPRDMEAVRKQFAKIFKVDPFLPIKEQPSLENSEESGRAFAPQPVI